MKKNGIMTRQKYKSPELSFVGVSLGLYFVLLTVVSGNLCATELDDNNVQKNDVTRGVSQKKRIENRIKLVGLLLTRTESHVPSVEGENDQFITQLDNARSSKLRAEQYLDEGALDKAETEVNYAIKLLSSVSVPVVTNPHDSASLRKEFRDVKERVESFRGVLLVICKEKNVDINSILPPADFYGVINEAEQLYEKSRVDSAVLKIKEAASLVEISLAKIRDKETIIHSLEFATIEEEYRYELERNKSHLMLIDLMLAQRSLNKTSLDVIDGLVKKNAENASAAKKHFDNKDMKEAKKTLEAGTEFLVQALRKGGMFIP